MRFWATIIRHRTKTKRKPGDTSGETPEDIFDQEFPRSIRYCTARLEEHLSQLSHGQGGRSEALRLAGRLNARLQYADVAEVAASGAGALLAAVGEECAAIHAAIHETFVAYPLELSLPA